MKNQPDPIAAAEFVAFCRPVGAPHSEARKEQAEKLKHAMQTLRKTEKEIEKEMEFFISK